MESRDDSTNAERILRNITPVSQLVNKTDFDQIKIFGVYFQLDVACQIYARGKQQEIERKKIENHDVSSREEEINDNTNTVAQTVGHNMYILAYQVIISRNELFELKIFSYLVIIVSQKF